MPNPQEGFAGLGIDVLEIQRMKSFLNRHSKRLHRVFSPKEIRWASRHRQPEIQYSCLFAAKEAAFKSLGISPALFFGWREIEIQPKAKEGMAVITSSLRLRKKAQAGKIRIAWDVQKRYVFALAIRKEPKATHAMASDR